MGPNSREVGGGDSAETNEDRKQAPVCIQGLTSLR